LASYTVTVPDSGKPEAAVPENVTAAAAGGSLAGGLTVPPPATGNPANPPPPPPPPPPHAASEIRSAAAHAQRVVWKSLSAVAGVAEFVFMKWFQVKRANKRINS
jgi:hypothetical protein